MLTLHSRGITTRNDWYCRVCGVWVDDDQPHIVCSNNKCEDIFHLKCVGLDELPQGDWFCSAALGGCHGASREDAATPAAMRAKEEGVDTSLTDGREWHMLPPLEFRGVLYPRVLCSTLKRVYYPMNMLAYDLFAMQPAIVSSLLLKNAPEIERLRVTGSSTPQDYRRLRDLGFISSCSMRVDATEAEKAEKAAVNRRVRVMITIEALHAVIGVTPSMQTDVALQTSMTELVEKTKDELSVVPIPDEEALEKSAARASLSSPAPRGATPTPLMSPAASEDPASMFLDQIRSLREEVARRREDVLKLADAVHAFKQQVAVTPPGLIDLIQPSQNSAPQQQTNPPQQ